MDPAQMGMNGVAGMKYNMRAMAKLYESLSKSCFKKCVTRFSQPDLSVGELTCVDRCTLKFISTAQLVSEGMQTAHEQEMKQQQAMQQLGQQRPF
mmetsp:Transcript_18592/g.33294  ORF Transcript_18592/g.33294 Transcript_18592/m.33294 type:complete len:95 (+) Transcript_18592:23-307(+)